VVRVHPETGRRCLYLGDHAESIVGLPYEEGRALIEELNALAVAHADLRYEHHWQPHELIVWDNRSLLHRATAFDTARHARVVRRCTVLGEVPVGDLGSGARLH
jgi:alpha-ketoglutarate-dependent taurine dioxygenase